MSTLQAIISNQALLPQHSREINRTDSCQQWDQWQAIWIRHTSQGRWRQAWEASQWNKALLPQFEYPRGKHHWACWQFKERDNCVSGEADSDSKGLRKPIRKHFRQGWNASLSYRHSLDWIWSDAYSSKDKLSTARKAIFGGSKENAVHSVVRNFAPVRRD